jgi:cell fate (sporulation/competence/biofilm development) regulator YlbF (YheA/YmcA/DUF963 family)
MAPDERMTSASIPETGRLESRSSSTYKSWIAMRKGEEEWIVHHLVVRYMEQEMLVPVRVQELSRNIFEHYNERQVHLVILPRSW